MAGVVVAEFSRGGVMVFADREMTDDELRGIEWWNGLSEQDRRFWLASACSAVPADAWAFFKGPHAETHSGGAA